ncbi:MAG: hypothetical protein K2K56_01155 [Lachnospiraceae bacterium]|nr:hypothetical protein [Lachnospiraceae bacterium]
MKKLLYCIAIFVLVVILCPINVYGKQTKLKKPAIGSMVATSKATVELIWSPVKNAQKYEIYRSVKKKGGYEKIGTTKKTVYVDKSGKQLKTYYYKIRAVCRDKTANRTIYSPYSIVMKKKVRKIAKKTAYAGDSLMVGLVNYGKIKETKSQRVFAEVGITTTRYYNSDLLIQLAAYKPDRLYIMLGVNDMAGNPSESSMNTIISYYEAILKTCIAGNPDMEIFVIGVSPVGKNSSISMKKVNYYNTKLEKKLLALKNVYYYDLALDLSDEEGYLAAEYAASDNLHWTSKAYDTVLKALREIVKGY